MLRAFKLGDFVRLPSGVEARITAAADPESPWKKVAVGDVSLLFRARMGDEGLPVVQFFGGNEAPLQFGAEMPGLSRNSSTAKAIAYK